MSKFMFALGIIVLVILLIIISPIALIWSVNTLFSLGIVVNLKTWFAAFLLLTFFGNGKTYKEKQTRKNNETK